MDDNIADRISELAFKQFDKLPKGGKPNKNQWTVLSCIVEANHNDLTVVALGTGSRCIGHDKMSHLGHIINDSHAEVICRRSFLRYLYEQMLTYTNDNQIFSLSYTDNKHPLFTLKDNIKFHFFSTQVPCGDAAIFEKTCNADIGLALTESNPHSVERDIYRTGAKCLKEDNMQDVKSAGVRYHTVELVRTKPGRGYTTLSVSCSDKLAKWCHVGIQGALLTIVMQPIYLSSFTICAKTPFSKEAFYRATCNRLKSVSTHPPFTLNMLTVAQSNYEWKFKRTAKSVPCPSSISWFASKYITTPEIIVNGRPQGATKKNLSKNIIFPKICKYKLFCLFHQILDKYNIKIQEGSISYKNTKLLAKSYQDAWNDLKVNGFKIWSQKDENLEQFFIEEF